MTDYRLDNKTALVTGVGRAVGIGAAIAKALAQAGANLFITYYHPYDAATFPNSRPDEVTTLLQELEALGVQAAGLELDLSQPDAPALLFERATAALGPVDILVNNACYSTRDGIAQLTAETLDKHYAVNVRAMALLCAEFARRFPLELEPEPERRGGRIINISSGQGVGPMPNELAYVASKGAVEAFTVSLSAELASRGITVNAVDPGATDTGWMSSDFKAELIAQAPMGRVGQPEDTARLVRFLASVEAGWITGQVIHSRGGT